jgi:hypothetical protein
MLALMSKGRLVLTISLVSLSSLSPSQVGAGGPYSAYKTEFKGGNWQEWSELGTGAIAVPRTAELLATLSSPCLQPDDPNYSDRGADGDEFDFEFVLKNEDCLGPANGGPSLVASFTWSKFDAPLIPVEFECLDVTGSVESVDDPEAEIRFMDASLFAVADGSLSTSTADRLTDVNTVGFELWSDALTSSSITSSAGEVGAELNGSVFDIEISISPCSLDFDGPDIEHYRQRAAEMTALPDTL